MIVLPKADHNKALTQVWVREAMEGLKCEMQSRRSGVHVSHSPSRGVCMKPRPCYATGKVKEIGLK